MIACVWLPQFALRVLSHSRLAPEVPAGVASTLETHPVILDCNAPASEQGVFIGQLVSRALGACAGLRIVEHDPERIDAAYERFLQRLEAMGAAAEPIGPGQLLFDAAPLYRLYGGREKVVARVLGCFPRADELRLGMAPTRFAAEIAARLARPRTCVAMLPEKVGESLAGLSLRLLPADERTLETWAALGLETMGDLTAIGEGHISDRFGDQGVHLWRLAQGIDARRVVPRVPVEAVDERMDFPDPVGNVMMLQRAVRVLVERGVGHRIFVHYAPRTVKVVAGLVSGGSWQSVRVLRTPTLDVQRIVLTATAQLEQVPAPVERLHVRFEQYALRAIDQRELGMGDHPVGLKLLQEAVRHVQSTLNDEAVMSVVEIDPESRIPEHRAVLVPADPRDVA